MERLTEWDKGNAYYLKCFEGDEGGCLNMESDECFKCPDMTEVCRRLAQYEDTGFSPDEIKTLLEALRTAIVKAPIGEIYKHIVTGDLNLALDKLAEYESTGMKPEEIKELNAQNKEYDQDRINAQGLWAEACADVMKLQQENEQLRQQIADMSTWPTVDERRKRCLPYTEGKGCVCCIFKKTCEISSEVAP